MITADAVAAARLELLSCPKAGIEQAASEAWAARALAAYTLAGQRSCVRWLLRATEYHHEATEHAGGVSPRFLAETESQLAACRTAALHAFTLVDRY